MDKLNLYLKVVEVLQGEGFEAAPTFVADRKPGIATNAPATIVGWAFTSTLILSGNTPLGDAHRALELIPRLSSTDEHGRLVFHE